MKKCILFSVLVFAYGLAFAQPPKTKYPEPEFANEVYLLRKDSTIVRLEKDASKMDTKMKMAGFGGMENGYIIEGEKSPVRIGSGEGLSFVFSTGASASTSSAASDSVMRANGMDPSMMSGMSGYGSMTDPASMITLYKANAVKGQRKIYTMKMGGAFSMGKNKSSDKYTFSVKKIREGYWELVIDKSLPKGEYAFSMMGGYSGGSGGMDAVLFAFAVDY